MVRMRCDVLCCIEVCFGVLCSMIQCGVCTVSRYTEHRSPHTFPVRHFKGHQMPTECIKQPPRQPTNNPRIHEVPEV